MTKEEMIEKVVNLEKENDLLRGQVTKHHDMIEKLMVGMETFKKDVKRQMHMMFTDAESKPTPVERIQHRTSGHASSFTPKGKGGKSLYR